MPYVSCAKLEAELALKQDQLVDSTGADLPAGACVLKCPSTPGTDGQVLTVQPDGSAAWETPAASGLLAVSHDATMTGDGSAGSPLSVVQATEAQRGAVELATTVEASTGTDTTTAVTPAGLKAALDVHPANLVDSQGNALALDACVLKCPTTAPTAGQVLTAQADGSTVWSTPASGGGGGLTAVAHDSSLSGDGTAGSPLAVVPFANPAGGAIAPGSCIIPCPSTAGSAGQVLTLGSSNTVSWSTVSGGGGSFSLFDCSGAAIASGGSVPSCTEFNTRVPTSGTDGQVLTKQADGSNAWETPTGGAVVPGGQPFPVGSYVAGTLFAVSPPQLGGTVTLGGSVTIGAQTSVPTPGPNVNYGTWRSMGVVDGQDSSSGNLQEPRVRLWVRVA